jgi:hypothetical protein
MRPLAAARRFLVTAALCALVAVPAMLLPPRTVGAFTLPPDILYFDPISVPIDHTLHVHLFNELGAAKYDFRTFIRPTTPAAGSPVVGATVTLAPGDGVDQDHAFAAFSPPSGSTRVPVVVTILVTDSGGGALPTDWSGRVASSVEIVDDKTGIQTAILGGRHVVRGPTTPGPCLFCN